MKMTKKKILVVALVVCLFAVLSVGTVAWFNANDSITNTFMIADSEGTGEPNFTVDVWETKNDGTGDKTQTGNTYDSIAPGDVLVKNPTVENTGDYSQWIRVYVTFDEYDVITAACTRNSLTTDLRTWLDVDSTAWEAVDAETVETTDKITYVYYYNYELAKDGTAVLFNKVSIPGAFEQEDMKYVSGDFAVTVKAEAIQSENTGTTAKEAFANNWLAEYSA